MKNPIKLKVNASQKSLQTHSELKKIVYSWEREVRMGNIGRFLFFSLHTSMSDCFTVILDFYLYN